MRKEASKLSINSKIQVSLILCFIISLMWPILQVLLLLLILSNRDSESFITWLTMLELVLFKAAAYEPAEQVNWGEIMTQAYELAEDCMINKRPNADLDT